MKRNVIKKLFGLIIACSSIAVAAGTTSCACGESDKCGSNEEFATPNTDSLKFALEDMVSNDNFIDAKEGSGLAISEAKVSSFTDGDTTNFRLLSDTENKSYKVRYQGVNTPESTGHIEPWGLKASLFTKTKLKSAERIVLVNDLVQYKKTDSSGGRYMGFVWYKPAGKDFRLLNLELVEQGFSISTINENSQYLTGYYKAFKSAFELAKKEKRRVNGSKDCDYDTSDKVVETTIANAKENFDQLGADSSSLSSGKKLRITAIITGKEGSNFYCRDLVKPDDADTYAGIYAFTQYKSIDLQPGYIVRFYCRISKYGGNYQLTDLETSTLASKYAFEYLAKTKAEVEALGYEYDINPFKLETSKITKYDDFGKYTGNYVDVNLTVAAGKDGKSYREHKTSSGNTVYTVYTNFGDYKLNIRLQDHIFFSTGAEIEAIFKVGQTYSVKCFLTSYQFDENSELEYQINLSNFKNPFDYITKL